MRASASQSARSAGASLPQVLAARVEPRSQRQDGWAEQTGLDAQDGPPSRIAGVDPFGFGRTRPDDAHLAAQDVDQVRQVVERVVPDDAPDRGQPLLRAERARTVHRPEPDQREELTAAAEARRHEEDGASRLDREGDCDRDDGRREQAQENGGDESVGARCLVESRFRHHRRLSVASAGVSGGCAAQGHGR
jgi:hypothetical protein